MGDPDAPDGAGRCDDVTPTIDVDKCVRCGQCLETCPALLFRREGEAVAPDPTTSDHCIACGHCMAVCPVEAVTVEGIDYAECTDVGADVPAADAVEALLGTRRSVRRFTEQPVSIDDLRRIVAAVRTAPMGVPPSVVEIAVFPSRESIEAILPTVVESSEQMVPLFGKWVGRMFLRRAMGTDQVEALEKYMLPLLGPMISAYRNEGRDCFTWGAPAMLQFHAPRKALSPAADCYIACYTAALAAHSMGLGATIVGVVAPVIDRDKELRTRCGVPEENRCIVSLIVGHPEVRFRRSIPRDVKAVEWIA
jgi:ferredoxin